MRRNFAWLLAFTLSLTAQCIAASEPTPLAVLPIHYDGKIAAVDFALGEKTLRLALDTGGTYTILDTKAARTMGLKEAGDLAVKGAGAGSLPGKRLAPFTLIAGKAIFTPDDAVALDFSHVGSEIPIDGLVGYEFFSRYVVEVNNDRSTVTLYDPATYAYRGKGVAIPLVMKPPRVYLRVNVAAEGVPAEQHELRLDSGSNDAVDDDIVLRGKGEKQATTGGVGIGERFKSTLGTVTELHLGPYMLKNLPSATGGVQLIGQEVLHRFNVVYDFSRAVMYLAPRKDLRAEVRSRQ